MDNVTALAEQPDELSLAARNRKAYIQGLRILADALESNPDLPIDPTAPIECYCEVSPENFNRVMSMLESPAIEDLPAHDIFYINQRFGGITLRYIQKKKGIYRPQVVDGDIKWSPAEVR